MQIKAKLPTCAAQIEACMFAWVSESIALIDSSVHGQHVPTILES